MNEQPGKDNPDGEDASGNPGKDGGEAEDFGTVSFFRASGGTRNGLPYLSSLSFDFDQGTPDPETGKRAFGTAITELNSALLDYERVLDARAGDFGQAFAPTPGDAELLAASDHVHDSLESLGLSHLAYTGHSFLEGPLFREAMTGPDDQGTPEEWAAQPEAEEPTEETDDTHWPRPHELGVTVVLDSVLHRSAEAVVRLDMAKVYGNGVMLVIDYVNLRAKDEDGLLWFRRSNEAHGNVEVALDLLDPSTGTAFACELHWAEGNVGPQCYTLNQHFWIHRALDAHALAGTLTVKDAIAADGTTEPLLIELEIDTEVLREAATRIRTLGTEGP
ncbi:hypothetical protein [Paeniglutamicibacter sp.]|uniref:hypothetical protein n=1 Tax=Paeniglutamicibacter sp. TaxID=1934391 RepID=UPI003988EB57